MIKRYCIFLLIALLGIYFLCLLANFGKNSSFPGKSPALGGVSHKFITGQGQNSLENNRITRIFKWKKHSHAAVISRFVLDKEIIKREMDNFGIILTLENPRYFKKQGFKKYRGNFVVDYQEIFTRNIKNFSQLSGSLKNSAELTGNADPLLEFLNFVQHITYKEPPKFWQGKYIREFFPPLQCLYEKYGDCDTKCVLLADFLATYPDSKERLAIIIIKGYGIFHTLLAVKRKPLIGMVSLNILGKGIYIPLETTARGWLPGFIGFQSKNCLLKGLLRFETLN